MYVHNPSDENLFNQHNYIYIARTRNERLSIANDWPCTLRGVKCKDFLILSLFLCLSFKNRQDNFSLIIKINQTKDFINFATKDSSDVRKFQHLKYFMLIAIRPSVL